MERFLALHRVYGHICVAKRDDFRNKNVGPKATLSREQLGPRAVLYALDRIAVAYGSECARVGKTSPLRNLSFEIIRHVSERESIKYNQNRDTRRLPSILQEVWRRSWSKPGNPERRQQAREHDVNKKQFWKNFALGEELDIAGRFIYNGLRFFHEMETLSIDSEMFEVLYNLSVGLERLLKIAVILIEHTDAMDQGAFEETLITHSQLDLLRRVRQKHSLPTLTGPHNELLQMLGKFYKSQRYGRFTLASAMEIRAETGGVRAFLEKHLKVKLGNGEPIMATANNAQLRKFLGKTVCKIARALYEVIRVEARGLNTHDIRNATKASKFFLDETVDFMEEEILWRELLVYLVNSSETRGYLGIIKAIKPLEFDPGLMLDHLQCFESEERKLRVVDELDGLYEDIPRKGKRIEKVMLIGDPALDFSDEGNEHEDDR